MCEYYNIEDTPGIKSSKSVDSKKFIFLDNEEIIRGMLDFTDGKTSKVTFYIPKIHCSSCIWLLENLYRLNPNVNSVMVNFVKKEASLTFNQTNLSLRGLVELLVSLGYEPEINLSSTKKDKKRIDRSLYYKIGVAGFSFGNIMLISFPEYLGASGLADLKYTRLFNYLNLFLAFARFLLL